jgi:diguanylate cyclase (GGDEF)-like protein
MADRNRYLAAFDVMTGLANRSQFQDRLAEIDSMTFHRHGALMLIDLDGFKQVNDTFGHALGDECLKVSAQRMNSVGSSASLLARIGGDEFAMLFSAKLTREQIEEVAKSVVSAFTHPIMLHGKTLNVGASVGIAYYSGGTSDDLFRQADTALYAAKGAGRGTYRIFSLELI